jgi:Spy/CpxP family protein refolding chaperone
MAETPVGSPRGKAVLLVAVVFLLGLVSGGAAWFAVERARPPEPFFGPRHDRPVEHLVRTLDLDPEQRARIEEILERQRGRLHEVLEESRLEIREVLRPDQLERFDTMRPPRGWMRRKGIGRPPAPDALPPPPPPPR